MMNTTHLAVSQSGLRNPERLENMIEFVRSGGVFTQDTLVGADKNKIKIIRTNAYCDLILNGHHRLMAIEIARNGEIHPDEYVLETRWPHEFQEFNPPIWFTPVDIWKETRLADFRDFKRQAEAIYLCAGKQAAFNYVKENEHLYKEPRKIWMVKELVVS